MSSDGRVPSLQCSQRFMERRLDVSGVVILAVMMGDCPRRVVGGRVPHILEASLYEGK